MVKAIKKIMVLMLCAYNAYTQTTLTFQQALIAAYQNNPELQSEIDKSEAMKGFFIQSKQYPNPLMMLTAENIGGSGLYSGYESAETTLSLAQPIVLGGRLKAQQKATYADYIASLVSIKVRKAELYTFVGLNYVDSLYAAQWYQVTVKLTQLNQNITSAIRQRMKAGAGTELDLRLAQIKLGEANIQQMRAKREMMFARAKLERIIGIKVMHNKKLTDKGLSHQHVLWPDIQKHLASSPQLLEKQFKLKAQRATINAVKKAIWPDLTVQLGARHFSDDNSNALVVSTGAPMPIFDRNQGKIATAEAQLTQISHELQGVRLELKKSLYGFYLQEEQNLYESRLVTDKLLPLAQKTVGLATEGYRQGRYSYIELANAINALYEEERHYQQAHANYHKAMIQMTGLLGAVE